MEHLTLRVSFNVLLMLFWTIPFWTNQLFAEEVVLFVADSQWDPDTDKEIHVMRPNGADHRIIATRFPPSSASIDNKGNWIAYTTERRREIRLVQTSGQKEKVLYRVRNSGRFDTVRNVRWSPDGRYVAYERNFSKQRFGLEVFDTKRRRVVLSKPVEFRRVVQINFTWFPFMETLHWSPNSRYIAFGVLYDRTGNGIPTVLDQRGLFVYDILSGRIRYKGRDLEFRLPRTLGFLSRNTLLRSDDEVSTFNFQTKRVNGLSFDTWSNSSIAVSPSGQGFLEDHYSMRSKYELFGVPRGRESDRNMAWISVGSSRGQFVTPLKDYSAFYFRPSDTTSFSKDRFNSFEWRQVRSSKIFRTKTCWGWVVTIHGTDGRDTIRGTNGPDVIDAGFGNDIVQALGGNDIVCGGDGNDRIDGGTGDDLLLGDVDPDHEDLADVVTTGDDTIDGGVGVDALYGFNGNDNLNGGSGNDFLNGGDGRDTCRRFQSQVGCE